MYQVMFSYHVPFDAPEVKRDPLSIDVDYDRSDLLVGDTVTATATVVNNMAGVAPMVILDLPIPAGFAVNDADLVALVQRGTIAKFQINPRSAVVYLRSLDPGKPVVLRYRLTATMPVRIAVPPAETYEYYNPEARGTSRPIVLKVTQRT